MNHATSAVTPLDQEMIQVGHAIWQRAERCGLIQGSVQSGRLPADVGGHPGSVKAARLSAALTLGCARTLG